jgi:uncharacterized heparinase superfamily protein
LKFKALGLLFRTVQYLKPIQVLYQLINRLGPPKAKGRAPSQVSSLTFKGLAFAGDIKLEAKNRFTFLNKSHRFDQALDWNFSEFGKLWTYNLNYFEYLHLGNLANEEKRRLIADQTQKKGALFDAWEPYPISLRSINWIRFISGQHQLLSEAENQYLYEGLSKLSARPEFHLLGNHLLENAFALLMGGAYFNQNSWIKQAQAILEYQLEEQILDDGAHFELSPMYHCIMLYRVLEAIDLLENNEVTIVGNLKNFLRSKAQSMLGHLEKITFSDGSLPMVNDASPGVSPPPDYLFKYAKELGLEWQAIGLSDSGYRIWRNLDFELFIDAGPVGPNYQPGHGHADTGNLILYYRGKPILVDTGTSTYQKDEIRQSERASTAHNVLTFQNENSSEVWGGFRVGRRASVNWFIDHFGHWQFEHDGYRHFGLKVTRDIKASSTSIEVGDSWEGPINEGMSSHWHFHPEVEVKVEGNQVILPAQALVFNFSESVNLELTYYQWAKAFNISVEGIKIVAHLTGPSQLSIKKL